MGWRGLADKSRTRRPGARKATLAVTKAVKELQESSAIGAHRMAAALDEQYVEVVLTAAYGRR